MSKPTKTTKRGRKKEEQIFTEPYKVGDIMKLVLQPIPEKKQS